MSDTRRLGTYWHRATFDLARSAYLADLDTVPDGPISFGAWVDDAISTHARLTPASRATLVDDLDAEIRDQRGTSKSVIIDVDTVAELEAAVVADRRNGRIVSRGEFVSEAVRAAARRARERYGRALPPPPPRLPNRPPRSG